MGSRRRAAPPARTEQQNGDQQLELARREQELARREQALAEREKTLDVTPVPAASMERSSTALAQRARTEIEAAYELALHNPRDLDDMRAKLLKTCKNLSFAEKALYTIKRGGKDISGPSIRFAEECLRLYRNVRSSRRMVHDDRESRTYEVSLTDLENNTTVSQEIEVEKVVERKFVQKGDVVIRQRQNSKDETVFLVEATLDDLRMKEGAELARSRRNLILELIPSWIRRDAQEAIERTINQGFKDDPDGSTKRVMDGFADRGVPPSALKEYLGRDEIGKLSQAEYQELRGALAAMLEGLITWGELFEQKLASRGGERKEEAAAAVVALRERGKQAIAAGQAQQQPAAAAPSAPNDGKPVPRDEPKAEAGSFAREPAKQEPPKEEPPPPASENPPSAGDAFSQPNEPREEAPVYVSDEEAIAGWKQTIERAGDNLQALEDIKLAVQHQHPEGGVVRTAIGPVWAAALQRAKSAKRSRK